VNAHVGHALADNCVAAAAAAVPSAAAGAAALAAEQAAGLSAAAVVAACDHGLPLLPHTHAPRGLLHTIQT